MEVVDRGAKAGRPAPPRGFPTLEFVWRIVKLRPSLLLNFSFAPPFVFAGDFVEATLSAQDPQDIKGTLISKANNNMLICSLLLGVSFSMIGGSGDGGFLPRGWEPESSRAMAYSAALEVFALCASMTFVVGLLANTGLVSTVGAVHVANMRLWAKANHFAIIVAEALVMLGGWFFAMALLLAAYAAIPYPSAFWTTVVLVGCPLSLGPGTLLLTVAPLVTTASGAVGAQPLVTEEQERRMSPAEAQAILFRRATAAHDGSPARRPSISLAEGGGHTSVWASPTNAQMVVAATATSMM